MERSRKNFWPAPDARAALVIAHPGHELLVHGWLEIARPRVFVLTDGSGRSGRSRLGSTGDILERTGARPGRIYGRLTDREAYAAILDHRFDLFAGLARELTEAFIEERIDYVAGDALEDYNPTHDVCRLLINAAVAAARRDGGRRIANFAFSLISQPPPCPASPPADEIWLRLDEAAFARKMAAARGYAELTDEVVAAVGRASVDAFRVECLLPAARFDAPRSDKAPPFYEHYGEKQVAAGHYQKVLRYSEHMAPLAEALKSNAE